MKCSGIFGTNKGEEKQFTTIEVEQINRSGGRKSIARETVDTKASNEKRLLTRLICFSSRAKSKKVHFYEFFRSFGAWTQM